MIKQKGGESYVINANCELCNKPINHGDPLSRCEPSPTGNPEIICGCKQYFHRECAEKRKATKDRICPRHGKSAMFIDANLDGSLTPPPNPFIDDNLDGSPTPPPNPPPATPSDRVRPATSSWNPRDWYGRSSSPPGRTPAPLKRTHEGGGRRGEKKHCV